MTSPGAAPDPQISSRLTRIEETCAFAQHDLDQLSTEVAAINRRLADLVRRVESLERRLAEADSDIDPTPVPPPHSAGPRS